MECPICYDSLHWKQVVCVPCGHLFHEACLNTFIQRRGAEYDEDVFDEDDDEDSAPKCPTCRTPIRQMGEEMMRELIPDFLRCRIHPAIRKVYLSPPTDDQAERMRETDHLWEKLEKIQRELSESASKVDAAETRAKAAENKASMMWNTVTVAEDKAKAAEKKASVLLRKVKDLGESLKKEQQRHKVFLHSVAVRSPKKAEVAYPQPVSTCPGMMNYEGTLVRNLDEEANQLVAQVEQMTQPQFASTVPTSQLGGIHELSAGPTQAPQSSQQFAVAYGGSQAPYVPAYVPPTSATPFSYGQARSGSYIQTPAARYPQVAAPLPVYHYAQRSQVEPQRLPSATATGSAQTNVLQSAPIPSAYPSAPHPPSIQQYAHMVSPVPVQQYQPYQPSYNYTQPHTQVQSQPMHSTQAGDAQPNPTPNTSDNEQFSQPHISTAGQLRPHSIMEDASGHPIYVYVTGDGGYVYLDRLI